MTDKFFEELSCRICCAHPDPAWEEFSIYVRVVRSCLGMDRAKLTQEAGLEKSFLSNLENGLLLPGERTEEVRKKIELALGTPYHEFKRLSKDLIAELKRDWGYGNFANQEDTAIGLSRPMTLSY